MERWSPVGADSDVVQLTRTRERSLGKRLIIRVGRMRQVLPRERKAAPHPLAVLARKDGPFAEIEYTVPGDPGFACFSPGKAPGTSRAVKTSRASAKYDGPRRQDRSRKVLSIVAEREALVPRTSLVKNASVRKPNRRKEHPLTIVTRKRQPIEGFKVAPKRLRAEYCVVQLRINAGPLS
jgi:hypothetical protein